MGIIINTFIELCLESPINNNYFVLCTDKIFFMSDITFSIHIVSQTQLHKKFSWYIYTLVGNPDRMFNKIWNFSPLLMKSWCWKYTCRLVASKIIRHFLLKIRTKQRIFTDMGGAVSLNYYTKEHTMYGHSFLIKVEQLCFSVNKLNILEFKLLKLPEN